MTPREELERRREWQVWLVVCCNNLREHGVLAFSADYGGPIMHTHAGTYNNLQARVEGEYWGNEYRIRELEYDGKR